MQQGGLEAACRTYRDPAPAVHSHMRLSYKRAGELLVEYKLLVLRAATDTVLFFAAPRSAAERNKEELDTRDSRIQEPRSLRVSVEKLEYERVLNIRVSLPDIREETR